MNIDGKVKFTVDSGDLVDSKLYTCIFLASFTFSETHL